MILEQFYKLFVNHDHDGLNSSKVKSKNIKWAPVVLPTDTNSGFLIFPTCAGTPTGTPTDGSAVFDTSANKLWIYNGSWVSETFT